MHSNPKTLKSHLKCTNVIALDANQLISIWKQISQMYIWSNLMTIIHCLVWFECLNTEIWGSLHINQVLKLKKKRLKLNFTVNYENCTSHYDTKQLRKALIVSCIYILHFLCFYFWLPQEVSLLFLLSAPCSVLLGKSCVKVNSTQWAGTQWTSTSELPLNNSNAWTTHHTNKILGLFV